MNTNMNNIEGYDWNLYDERLDSFEDFVLNSFKLYLQMHNVNYVVEELSEDAIPPYYPKLMKDFYRKFAPIDLTVNGIQFIPFPLVFQNTNEDNIFIAIKDDMPLYIDKYLVTDKWDLRIEYMIGDGTVDILGSNIFDFICKLIIEQ